MFCDDVLNLGSADESNLFYNYEFALKLYTLINKNKYLFLVAIPLRTIQVYFSGLASGKYTYKFTTSSKPPQWPWNKVTRSKNLGEVEFFNLYER